MATLDGRPDIVDVAWLAGDTLTLEVTAPAVLVDGKEWLAQVRADEAAATVDATFVITPPTVADGPAYLVLPAAVTRALAAGVSGLTRVSSGPPERPTVRMVQRYAGKWDCQVSAPGETDPVRTLAMGALTLDLDVSRAEP